MGRLANLISTAATASLPRPLLTSQQIAAFTDTELPPCHCDNRLLCLSHHGDWFCDQCEAWLQADLDGSTPPPSLPAVAARFWSVCGRAVAASEMARRLRMIDAILLPGGEILEPNGPAPWPRRWWRWPEKYRPTFKGPAPEKPEQ